MCIGLDVKCTLFLLDFDGTSIFSAVFRKILKQNFIKICPVGDELYHADRRTDRHNEAISIVKPTRCTIFEFIKYHSTCFGRSFRPSSGVQDCTHSIRYMSYRLVDCLLAGTRWNLMLYVQSLTPDDGRKDRPKHVKWYSINSKIVHLFGCTIEIYHDAWSHERQITKLIVAFRKFCERA
jgi:hypothetical protein